MIKTQNQGIEAAVCEVKSLSLPKKLRLLYEAHLKDIRDQRAIEAYIRDEAREEGREWGRKEGKEEGIDTGLELARKILLLSSRGASPQEIADQLQISLEKVQKMLK